MPAIIRPTLSSTLLVLLAALVLPATLAAQTAPPDLLHFQARLAQAGGAPLNGAVNVEVRIYDGAAGGATLLWSEVHNTIALDGVVNLLLGAVTPFPATLFETDPLYLALKVGGDAEMIPRRRIAALPFARRAASVAVIDASTAIGADLITGTHVLDGSLQGVDLADQAIDSAKILDGSVDWADLAFAEVTSTHLAANSVDSSKILDGSLDWADFAFSAVDGAHLAADAVDGSKVLDGSLDWADFAFSVVDGAHIAAGAILGSHLAPDAVDGAKILDGSVDWADLAFSAVDSARIAPGAILSSHIAPAAVDGAAIAANAVDGTHIAPDAVDGSKIRDGSVDATELASPFSAPGLLQPTFSAQASAAHGTGLKGEASATSGTGVGVFGEGAGDSGTGVYGKATATVGNTVSGPAGVFGKSLADNGVGVLGVASHITGATTGVVGATFSPNGFGVFAQGPLGATGTKSFVQPHPADPTREIRFVCLEGNESGTYFRGQGQLSDGVAILEVPEDFRLVSEPRGLTVQVTARGPAMVWVDACDLERIVVRGSADVPFDYFVNGVRRGFAGFETMHANTSYRPKVRGVPYGTELPGDLLRVLVENGILNPDFTPNEQTAARLGWKLRDPAPSGERGGVR